MQRDKHKEFPFGPMHGMKLFIAMLFWKV